MIDLLESKVGSGIFLESLTAVNMDISRKRIERKKQRAVEKATDPAAAADRRRERLEAGKVCCCFANDCLCGPFARGAAGSSFLR